MSGPNATVAAGGSNPGRLARDTPMLRPARAGLVMLFALLACALLVAPAGAAEKQPAPQGQQKKPKQKKPKQKKKETLAEKIGVLAESWAVIDARTGEVLASQAANKRLPIASTTKLMTAYVAMKEAPLDKLLRAAPYEAEYGESLLEMDVGEPISVRDLIYGLILKSGNDAAHTLAVRLSGSTKRFVAEMNRYAAALGLANTHYANPIGLDQKGNYSSARDLLTLSQRLLRMPAFAKISDSRSALLKSTRPPRRIETINELLLTEPWTTGVKTGHTWGAGWILVASGRKKGVDLISVAIAAPTDETRYSDNLALLEYGFAQYEKKKPVKSGEQFAEATIEYSGGSLPLRAAHGIKVGIRKDQDLSVKVKAPDEVEGPIGRGAKLGTVSVYVDGLKAGAVPLKAARAVPEASSFDRARAFLADYWIFILVALGVILIGGVMLYRRRSR